MTLKVDGKAVATKRMERTLSIILQWDESFDIGSDTLTGVNDAGYKPPFPLTAKFNKLTIKLDPPADVPGGHQEAPRRDDGEGEERLIARRRRITQPVRGTRGLRFANLARTETQAALRRLRSRVVKSRRRTWTGTPGSHFDVRVASGSCAASLRPPEKADRDSWIQTSFPKSSRTYWRPRSSLARWRASSPSWWGG
jgi:hypothetical protein